MTAQESIESYIRDVDSGANKMPMTMACLWIGAPAYEIYARGRCFYFEWHPHCGPTVINRLTGEPTANQPGERSPFWDAVQRWHDQGKIVKDGVAVWN